MDNVRRIYVLINWLGLEGLYASTVRSSVMLSGSEFQSLIDLVMNLFFMFSLCLSVGSH